MVKQRLPSSSPELDVATSDKHIVLILRDRFSNEQSDQDTELYTVT